MVAIYSYCMFNSILCSYDMFVHQKRWNKEQLSSVVMQQPVDVPNGRVTWWDLLMNAARIKCLYIKRVEQKRLFIIVGKNCYSGLLGIHPLFVHAQNHEVI